MKILSVILLLAALAMAFLAMIFGTRFAALLNKGQQRHGLPEKERRQRNRSGAVPVRGVRPGLAGGASVPGGLTAPAGILEHIQST